ncbi:MAG: hypothetical protein G01um1014106_228 [Parcubacteria group bacterium Gr01-1014_106]|nr:MAG: hypothetical protein G01um1014106_228 [Parcubacteria group bacterium Gr01-1014_106]
MDTAELFAKLLKRDIEELDSALNPGETSAIIVRDENTPQPVAYVDRDEAESIDGNFRIQCQFPVEHGFFLISAQTLISYLLEWREFHDETIPVLAGLRPIAVSAVWKKIQFLQLKAGVGRFGVQLTPYGIRECAFGLLLVTQKDIEADLNTSLQMYLRDDQLKEEAEKEDFLCHAGAFAERVCIANLAARCDGSQSELEFLRRCRDAAFTRARDDE